MQEEQGRMPKMIDIHCHILPDIDDGADSLDTSIEMCKIASIDGINTIIATPHYIPGHKQTINSDMVLKQVDMLNRELESKNIDVTILPGMEIFISHDIMELYEHGDILTLNKSRYMLIELPANDIPIYTEELFYELMIKDIVPIIAHPERNKTIRNNVNIAFEYSLKGILLQVNTESLTGILGKQIQKAAQKFLKNNALHFISTDAHSTNIRVPRMKTVYNYVNKFDSNLADRIFFRNPIHLINNEEIPN